MKKVLYVLLFLFSSLFLFGCTFTLDDGKTDYAKMIEFADTSIEYDGQEHTIDYKVNGTLGENYIIVVSFVDSQSVAHTTVKEPGVYRFTLKLYNGTDLVFYKTATLTITEAVEYSTEWSYNETQHWHDPLTEGVTTLKDLADHTYGAGVDVNGTTVYTCTVCGQQKVVSLGDHTHEFEEGWTSDDTYHWHKATCEHDVVSGKAEHTYGAWTVVTEPTLTEDGSKERTCSVCGHKQTEAIAKLSELDYTLYVKGVTKTAYVLVNQAGELVEQTITYTELADLKEVSSKFEVRVVSGEVNVSALGTHTVTFGVFYENTKVYEFTSTLTIVENQGGNYDVELPWID